MFEGLNLIIPMLAMLLAGSIGLLFVVAGWIKFAAGVDREPEKKTLKPLLAFTAAVCFDFSLYPVLSILDGTALFQGYLFNIAVPRIAFGVGFVLNVGLLLVAFGLGLRNANRISGIVKLGSILSLLIEGAGVVLFVIAQYST